MAAKDQAAAIAVLAKERNELQGRIRQLAEDRDGYLKMKVEEAGGLDSSLDKKMYDVVTRQSAKAGLDYDDNGPAY